RVFGVARRQRRVDVSAKFGPDAVINSSTQDVGKAVAELTCGNGADIVIDNVGTRETFLQALAAVHRGGRIVMVGETDDTLPLSTFKLCVSELDVMGSRSGGREDTVEAIQLVESGVVTPFASDIFPLELINDALDAIREGKVMGRAVVTLD
ncbi:MAG TPA: zinc-binding dehydrogenase, partial [Nitrososphaerales archaeon]|nr:zinc-binding dehydrogenase [Nitrososphaerales archaeon]